MLFRSAVLNGTAEYWYLRTPGAGSIPGGVWHVADDGESYVLMGTYGVRPSLVLPSAFMVPDNTLMMSSTPAHAPQGMPYESGSRGAAPENTGPVQEQAALPPLGVDGILPLSDDDDDGEDV